MDTSSNLLSKEMELASFTEDSRSDTSETTAEDVFSENGSTTSDLLPPHDEFMPTDLHGYPQAHGFDEQYYRNLRPRTPLLSIEKLKVIDRIVTRTVEASSDMVDRVLMAKRMELSDSKDNEKGRRVVKTAAGLVFVCGGVWRYTGAESAGLSQEPLRTSPSYWKLDVGFKGVVALGPSSATRQLAQVLFFRHLNCFPHWEEDFQPYRRVRDMNEELCYGDDDDLRCTFQAFRSTMRGLNSEFTKALITAVYEWVTVFSCGMSLDARMMNGEHRLQHWESALTPQAIKNIFRFLQPGLDLETMMIIPILMSWASRMVSLTADHIITTHYGADDYVSWYKVKNRHWTLGGRGYGQFEVYLEPMRARFKLQDIPMGRGLLVEDQDESGH